MINSIEESFPFGIKLDLKREDLINSEYPGNKYYKLKYNILQAIKENKTKLITFGGAYSNHILAVSFAGKNNNMQTFAFIRGEELENKKHNPNLEKAKNNGMKFVFVTRDNYRDKKKLLNLFFKSENKDDFYIIPEGGTNHLAVKGTQEILNDSTKQYDYICLAVGTGGTISGIINAKENHQQVIGFPALKDSDFLYKEINKYTKHDFKLICDYHFGGFAKKNNILNNFIQLFYMKNNIIIEPVYTGKMMYGIFQEIYKGTFKEKSKILAIHTGGLENFTINNIKIK